MDKLCLKIHLPDGEIPEREVIDETKRLKADGDYIDVGWRVLGVPFGGPVQGRDLDGEAFHDNTDIWIKTGDQVNMTYYHGYGPDDKTERQAIPVLIGRATYMGRDERGHWFEPALDMEEPLVQRLVMAGVDNVKASSGAVNHLVRKSTAGLIDVWPVGELALFDVNDWRQPANDFAVVETMKAKPEAITEAGNSVVAVEAKSESVDPVSDELTIKTISNELSEEVTIMEDETKETPVIETEKIDYSELKKSIIEELKAEQGDVKGAPTVKAPAVISSVGEKDQMKAFLSYLRTGQENATMRGLKASNDTDMNIGTAEDGQYLVPTGHYQNVIARRDESLLATKLGVTEIPGIGTTVNVPYDNEADGEFVVATETAEFDDDAPATGRKQLTFAKYAKIIRISHELLRDEDSRLEPFLANWVGRGMAKTENDLLITEVESYGTSLKTFASATAVAVGEMEAMVFGADMVSYIDSPSTNWVMSGPSYAKIASLTGNPRSYVETPQGKFAVSLMGFPVHFSNKADTIAASKESIFFGDWSQVGVRHGAGLQLIRDPYTRGRYGQIELIYLFDVVYGVLNSEAIGYGVHPSA